MTTANFVTRGGSSCESAAGLAKHGTNDDNLLTANAVVYAIDGKAYSLAAQTEIVTGVLAEQAADTTCYYVLGVDSAGAETQYKGVERFTYQVTDNVGTLRMPTLPEGITAIGYYKVVTVAVPFIHGTTAFDASGVTTTFTDVSQLPGTIH